MTEKLLVGLCMIVIFLASAGALYLEERGYCISASKCTVGSSTETSMTEVENRK